MKHAPQMLGATHPDLSQPDHLLWAATTAMGQLLSGEDLHLTIGAALATLGQAVDADRVYIFENHFDPDSGAPLVSLRHEWCAASAETQIDNPDLQNIPYEQAYIRWYHTLAAGQAIAGLVRDFPPSERPLLEAQSIRSLLVLPIQIGSQFWGFIGFDDCRSDRLWTPLEQQVLRAMAAALGNAYVRLEAEETLRANQAQYQMAVRAGQVGVWNWDLRTNAIDLDPQLKQMLGYEEAEIRNHIEDWSQHVHPEDRERVMAAVRDHLDGLTPEYRIEHRMLHKDGSLRWFLACGVAVREANGEPCRMLGTDTDITELHQSRERERLAGVVFDAAQESIMVTDAQAQIIAVNPAFTRISGYSEAEVMGQNPRLLKSGHQSPSFYASLWQSLERNGVWHGEFWNRRKDGELYLALTTISAVRDTQGRVSHYVGIATDITGQKEAEQRIEHLAYYDPLTELPNRALLTQRAELALSMATRLEKSLAVFFLDLDRFKEVNDSLGHSEGDALLLQVTARLRTLVRDTDTLSRLGGDEFVLLLPGAEESGALKVAEKILTAFRVPFNLSGHPLGMTISIGIAIFPHDGHTIDELLKNADTALHRAKQNGRNRLEFYDRTMNVATFERLMFESDLRQAQQGGQLRAFYQPKVRLSDGQLMGAEALIRWQHPERGLVLPGQFIPVAETSDLIVELGEWMLDEVCTQLAHWRQEGLAPISMAVNLGARHFRNPGFVDRIRERLRHHGLPAHCLELELTESVLLDNTPQIQTSLTALEHLGVGLAIDDFGTGYSSLGYLKRLPLTTLKIDRSFVQDLETDPNDRALAATIVALGHSLGLEIVAEGVESETQRRLLLEQGCDLAQGYLFSPPVPADEFRARFLSTGR